uniref:G-protein coupled receptors family 1 profile domain-containing protein n=1 Tax=Octopus bimaculoides TaxID=37653 RepID=A0A0L8HQ52_OCTBM
MGEGVDLAYPSASVRVVLILSMSVFCLITVVSNILVIVTVILTKKLRTISSAFLLNLCVADLGNGLLTMPFIIIGLAYDGVPLTQVSDSLFIVVVLLLLIFLKGSFIYVF